MRRPLQRGLFIAVYGINNIGKTTQVELLVERLKKSGYEAERIKYPVYDSPTGKKIDAILRSGKKQGVSEQEFQKLYIRNREESEETLRRKLDGGTIIVAEDYRGTGIAWGVAKGLDYAWAKRANAHLLKEDLAILMDGERFLQGKEKIHLHEQDDALLDRVRRQLLIQASDFGYHIIDANRTVEEVSDAILGCIRKNTALRV